MWVAETISEDLLIGGFFPYSLSWKFEGTHLFNWETDVVLLRCEIVVEDRVGFGDMQILVEVLLWLDRLLQGETTLHMQIAQVEWLLLLHLVKKEYRAEVLVESKHFQLSRGPELRFESLTNLGIMKEMIV